MTTKQPKHAEERSSEAACSVVTDSSRLDWLESNARRIKAVQHLEHHTVWSKNCGITLRHAIDRAMAGIRCPHITNRPNAKLSHEEGGKEQL